MVAYVLPSGRYRALDITAPRGEGETEDVRAGIGAWREMDLLPHGFNKANSTPLYLVPVFGNNQKYHVQTTIPD
jgi:hypothetical protein